MAGSISQFKSSFSTDVARPNRFDVIVPVPIGLVPYIGLTRTLNLRCEAAELPGRTIATTNMKIYGVEEKFPYMTMFNDIDLTFIVEDGMEQKVFFDTWISTARRELLLQKLKDAPLVREQVEKEGRLKEIRLRVHRRYAFESIYKADLYNIHLQ
mgnify:CR=1 FL=1